MFIKVSKSKSLYYNIKDKEDIDNFNIYIVSQSVIFINKVKNERDHLGDSYEKIIPTTELPFTEEILNLLDLSRVQSFNYIKAWCKEDSLNWKTSSIIHNQIIDYFKKLNFLKIKTRFSKFEFFKELYEFFKEFKHYSNHIIKHVECDKFIRFLALINIPKHFFVLDSTIDYKLELTKLYKNPIFVLGKLVYLDRTPPTNIPEEYKKHIFKNKNLRLKYVELLKITKELDNKHKKK